MKHIPVFLRPIAGFSLVEMAIVLTIVALLLGGLLPTISGQIEQQRRNETRKQLAEIQQALLGFAIMNKRLPCPMPATINNPTDVNYGLEAASCTANPTAEGYLPWKTLGVSETDAWGIRRSSAGSPWIGYWRYRTNRNFSNVGSLITLSTDPTTLDALSIVDNNWTNITSLTERPVAIVYSTGPDLTPNGKNDPLNFLATTAVYQSDVAGKNPDGTNFDDIMIWISRPQLFNRMVAAGALP
jgi:prepilin-type N-terminal cleavage/methylation domain-containing protein